MQSGQHITPFLSASGEGTLTAKRLTDIVDFWAVHQPDKIAYRFLADGLHEESTITFGELEKRAKHIATHLHTYNYKAVRCCFILPGLNTSTHFWGVYMPASLQYRLIPLLPRLNMDVLKAFSVIHKHSWYSPAKVTKQLPING